MNRETAAVRMGERWAERGAATMRTPAADWPLRWPHGSENARSLVEPMIDDDTPDRGHLVARLTEICLDSARRRFREVRVRRIADDLARDAAGPPPGALPPSPAYIELFEVCAELLCGRAVETTRGPRQLLARADERGSFELLVDGLLVARGDAHDVARRYQAVANALPLARRVAAAAR